jgi:ABC-type Fe3+/spermidine/putrescine transport system ATPase subunit
VTVLRGRRTRAGTGGGSTVVGADAPAVKLDAVRKAFGAVVAVDRFDLELRSGEMLALLGPSGCGKTTALRLIAGFERPDSGAIEIRGRRVASPGAMVPPERRRVGMVFQDFALFPHLSVWDNIAYGIRRDPDHRVRVAQLLDLVGLEPAARRLPGRAVRRHAAACRAGPSARATPRCAAARRAVLGSRPDVRTQLRTEVREILREDRQSSIFVTHDQDEALTIADRVCVMHEGRIEQCTTPETLYGEPATPFVAHFVGVATFVPGVAATGRAETALGQVRLVGPGARSMRGACRVVVRPEHLDLVEAVDGAADPRAWTIRRRRFSGTEILFAIEGRDDRLVWAAAGPHVRRLRPGDTVIPTIREDVETVAFGGDAALPPVAIAATADEVTPVV